MNSSVLYPLASSSWDDGEIAAMRRVMDRGFFTMGAEVKRFEAECASFFGARYAVMVNSGSSANLLMVAAMSFKSERPLKPGDEVIVPAVSWSTTYYPIAQYGMHLRFVDIDATTLNADLDEIERAITPRTRAIFAVNLLGCPNRFDRLLDICKRHNLYLLEDNCESMGATFSGKFAGTFGLMGSLSCFFSHHISTMEGGVILTDDEEMSQLLISLRAHGWTRELPAQNHVHNKTGSTFDDLFRFVLPGYNVRPLELSGAIGIEQLKKLPSLLAIRRKNSEHFLAQFAGHPNIVTQAKVGEPSWFGFAMTLRGALLGRRAELVSLLGHEGVECRPIVAGNFTRNPVMRHLAHSISGNLVNADAIHENGLFVGNHAFDLTRGIVHLRHCIDSLVGCSGRPS
jgi:CDP-4-dehydro-6-deoxyglucose reductase, E1